MAFPPELGKDWFTANIVGEARVGGCGVMDAELQQIANRKFCNSRKIK